MRRAVLVVVTLSACWVRTGQCADVRVAADSWITIVTPDTNYGTYPTIRVRKDGMRVGFIRFDTVPGGTHVMLKLRVDVVHRGGPVRFHLVPRAWEERTITSNNEPGFNTDSVGSITIAAVDAGKTVLVDVTPAATFWRAHPDQNFGLAIDAPDRSVDVYFGTRNGGHAAFLSGSGVVGDNDVTVSKSGGDYTDPLVAANNAFSGDRWCNAPTASNPCVIHVAEGVFVLAQRLRIPAGVNLLGAGKGKTILTGRGVSFSGLKVADLTINGGGLGYLDEGGPFPQLVENVSVRVQGDPASSDSLAFGSDLTHLTITDSDFTIEGGTRCHGILVPEGTYEIVRSRIQAICATRAEGINQSSDIGFGTLIVRDSSVYATASDLAFGVLCTAESGQCSVSGSNVHVESDDLAEGIAGDFGVAMDIADTRVIARGATGKSLGISGGFEASASFSLDGVAVEGSVDTDVGSGGNVSVLGSQFSALAITNERGSLTVRIEHSVNRGRTGVASVDPGQLTVRSSVLAAPRDFTNVTASCSDVYDENNRLLRPNCTP